MAIGNMLERPEKHFNPALLFQLIFASMYLPVLIDITFGELL